MNTVTHIEVELDGPIVCPKVAWPYLEEQIRSLVKTQLEGGPEDRLWPLVRDALEDLFIGIRTTSPGLEIVVRRQTIPLEVYVIESRNGKVTRRRRLSRVKPIEIVWPKRRGRKTG